MHPLNVSPDRHRLRSSEVRRLRKEAADSPRSQSTQYYTPRSSFDHAQTEMPHPAGTGTGTHSSETLARTQSAPLKKRRSATASALARMMSCVVCHGQSQKPVHDSPLPPRRLKSGEVDLLRFEKTEAQAREVYVPRRSSSEIVIPPSSLPITVSPAPLQLEEEEDYTFLKNVQRLKRMSGRWALVKSRSDSFAKMSELLEFNWVFRKALDNSDIIDIRVEDQILHQSGRVFKLVDIVERLDLTGKEVALRRRDMRRGPLFVKTFLTPVGYINKLHWSEPYPGGLIETFEFADNGKDLTVRMHVYRTDGRSCNLTLYWERMV